MNGVTIVKVNGELNENKMSSSARPVSAVHPHPAPPNRYALQHFTLVSVGRSTPNPVDAFRFSGFEEPWLHRQEMNRVVITPRLRLIGDSRSTGRLHPSAPHRSMTKLNNGNLSIARM